MRIFFQVILYYLSVMIFCSCNNKSNKLKLNFDSSINKHDVKIKMEVLASVPITEIYNGEKQFNIPDGYGENEWYLYYRDTLQGYIRYIKTNQNDKHTYKFNFYNQDGKYFVDIDIKGYNPVKYKIELKNKRKKQN